MLYVLLFFRISISTNSKWNSFVWIFHSQIDKIKSKLKFGKLSATLRHIFFFRKKREIECLSGNYEDDDFTGASNIIFDV